MNGQIIRHIYRPAQTSRQLAIIIPAYNEEDNLPIVIPDWIKVAKETEGQLIIINDGSRDQTLEVLRKLFHQDLPLTIIDKENSGHASSCLLGYQYALAQDFEWIFQTDSDGQTNPQEFSNFWSQKEQFPFIFGYRPQRGDGSLRWLISKILALSIFLICRIYVKDANVPFRLMQSQALKEVLQKIPANIFLANAFLTALIQKTTSIHWIPITFSPRQKGSCSVNGWKFLKVGKSVIKDFWKHRKCLTL